MVTRIDRLARSTFDLFAIVKQIVEAGGQCRSLAGPWADTATSTGGLMIAVLGGLADVERDLIRTRTAEGRSRVKAARAWWAASVFGRRSISNGRPYRLYRATGLVRVLVRARRCICSVVRLNVHQNTGRLALSSSGAVVSQAGRDLCRRNRAAAPAPLVRAYCHIDRRHRHDGTDPPRHPAHYRGRLPRTVTAAHA